MLAKTSIDTSFVDSDVWFGERIKDNFNEVFNFREEEEEEEEEDDVLSESSSLSCAASSSTLGIEAAAAVAGTVGDHSFNYNLDFLFFDAMGFHMEELMQ